MLVVGHAGGLLSSLELTSLARICQLGHQMVNRCHHCDFFMHNALLWENQNHLN